MTFDVAALLEQGWMSVSHTQTYVAACHVLGYQHPDLTAHGAQVLQWYGEQDGMDLAALDADCARLRAAVSAAEQALQIEREGAAMLAAGWGGGPGSAATDFVERHCASAALVVDRLRAAAEGCAALREVLWRVVQDKVDAAVTIDDRRAEVRQTWLAAAQTVLSGAPDRAEAVDVVTHQITSYVDADIRTDWLGAMRAATASADRAYADLTDRLSAMAPTYFDVPGQLGPPPANQPPSAAPVVSSPPAPPAMTVPAAATPVDPPVAAAPAPPPAPPGVEPAVPQTLPPPSLPEPAGIGAGAMPGMPGVPDVGGGLSGLVGQMADALGGLFTPPAEALDPVAPDAVDPGDNPPSPEPTDTEGSVDETEETDPEHDSPDIPEEEDVNDATSGEPPPESPEPAGEDVAPAEPSPPPAEPPPQPPPPGDPADEPTPCEIAADELPQVGQ